MDVVFPLNSRQLKKKTYKEFSNQDFGLQIKTAKKSREALLNAQSEQVEDKEEEST